ncbi:MAG: RNA-binding S4 domain-containing protein, partial [Gallionella sp.]|nr:RNA-binding S4 domain-containing protein [Gallionella sp.]
MNTGDDSERFRIDKWLWAARFFKTRALAQAAVTGGKVKLRGERVKPAKEIRSGDELTICIGEYEWKITVKG